MGTGTRRASFVVGVLLGWMAAGLNTVGVAADGRTVQPPHPSVESPIDFFRRLLAMEPTAREAALAEKTPRQRDVLERKIKEYEAMSRAEREARLQRLRLPMHLLPLMQLPPESRAERLQRVPAEDRILVAARLSEWNRLSPEQQQQVLTNRTALQYFVRPHEENAPVLEPTWKAIIPPPVLADLESDLGRWNELGEGQRAAIVDKFRGFFHTGGASTAPGVSRLTSEERWRMQVTLTLFAELPDAKREQCLLGLGHWTHLTAEERRSFSLNAQRWLTLTPEEKELWRRMILRLHAPPPPPMPDARREPGGDSDAGDRPDVAVRRMGVEGGEGNVLGRGPNRSREAEWGKAGGLECALVPSVSS